MCLIITQLEPYNDSKYRYKVLRRSRVGELYYSPLQGGQWKDGKMGAGNQYPYTKIGEEAERGIHVFTALEDARMLMIALSNLYPYALYCVVKVTVDGFLGAGVNHRVHYAIDETRGEVWNKAEIVGVEY